MGSLMITNSIGQLVTAEITSYKSLQKVVYIASHKWIRVGSRVTMCPPNLSSAAVAFGICRSSESFGVWSMGLAVIFNQCSTLLGKRICQQQIIYACRVFWGFAPRDAHLRLPPEFATGSRHTPKP